MKCPACQHALTRITIDSLEVDACQFGCGGIWFDLFELQQVDDPHEVAGEALLHIPRNEAVKVDPMLKRECPRCLQMKLKRRPFSPGIPVEVDECPACGGFWLDAGELEQIRVQKGRLQKTPPSSNGVSAHAIRTLYRMKTADRDEL